MNKTYVVERKIEYWISQQIEEVFVSLGHDVDVFPQSMIEEKARSADFIFASDTLLKVFGLQYKTLYHDQFSNDYWRIYGQQHINLKKFDWMYYGLSELKDVSERNIALHLCRFRNPSYFNLKFNSSPKKEYKTVEKSSLTNYRRWGGFYKGLLNCKIGKRITSEKMYHKFLDVLNSAEPTAILTGNNADLFLVDFTARRTIKFSAQIAGSSPFEQDNTE